MAHDVFISYSSKDKPTADAVCAGLETHGVRCWIAPRDVLTTSLRTTDWAPAILDAIRHTKLMVLVYSSNANASDQVRRELDSAMRYSVPILPFRIEDVPVSEKLEWYLSLPHWLDALTPPLEKHIEELASTARILVDRLAEQDESKSDGKGPVSPPPERVQDTDQYRRAADDLVEQARLAMDQTRYDDALRLAGQALEIDASHVGARSLHEAAERLIEVQRQLDEARAALQAGRFEQAMGPTEAALRADPQNLEAQELRAEAESALTLSEASSGASVASEQGKAAKTEQSSNGQAAPLTDEKTVIPQTLAPTPRERAMLYAQEHRNQILAAVAAAAVLVIIGIIAVSSSDWRVPTRSLQLDQPVTSTLTGGGRARERWLLTLTSTEDLRIELSNLAEDYDLFVNGPNGRSDSSRNAGAQNDIVTIARAPAGTYQIDVQAYGVTSYQPYRLAAMRGGQAILTPSSTASPSASPGPGNCTPVVSTCPLQLDQSVSAVITSAATTHRWYIDLNESSNLRIELTDLPTDYDLFVTGPGGLNESSTRAGRADDVVAIQAAARGRYEIAVRPALSVTPTNQPYRLTVRRGAAAISTPTGSSATPTTSFSAFNWSSFFDSTPTPTTSPRMIDWSRLFGNTCPEHTASMGPLTLGQPASGVLTTNDRIHTWVLTLPGTMNVRIELSNLDVDYDLYVSTPDGRCQSSTFGGASDDVVELRAAPAGDYVVVVRGVADPSQRPYRLTATAL